MPSAFVDTTVLVNILLKVGETEARSRAALEAFETSQLPALAIKEFKRGALKYYAWMHNKLVSAPTLADAMSALHRMSRTPRRYTTSSALEAIVMASSSIGQKTSGTLVAQYGDAAKLESVLRDEMRLAIKRKIHQAWLLRRSVTTEVVHPLSCYNETAPYEKRGLIELDPVKCDREPSCCLTMALRSQPDNLRKMKEAIDTSGSDRREDRKRGQALRRVYRTKDAITDEICRDLGDATFVALAPSDATILTTNEKDHSLLANAIGKHVQAP